MLPERKSAGESEKVWKKRGDGGEKKTFPEKVFSLPGIIFVWTGNRGQDRWSGKTGVEAGILAAERVSMSCRWVDSR